MSFLLMKKASADWIRLEVGLSDTKNKIPLKGILTPQGLCIGNFWRSHFIMNSKKLRLFWSLIYRMGNNPPNSIAILILCIVKKKIFPRSHVLWRQGMASYLRSRLAVSTVSTLVSV